MMAHCLCPKPQTPNPKPQTSNPKVNSQNPNAMRMKTFISRYSMALGGGESCNMGGCEGIEETGEG